MSRTMIDDTVELIGMLDTETQTITNNFLQHYENVRPYRSAIAQIFYVLNVTKAKVLTFDDFEKQKGIMILVKT